LKIVRHLLALLIAATLAACGGGSETAATAESVSSALRAQAGALSAVSPADAANQLMNLAESALPSLFPEHQTTHTAGTLLYRVYSTGIYLAVVVADTPGLQFNGIYVMGGPWVSPTYIGQVSQFITAVDPVPVNKNLVVSGTVNAFGTPVNFGPYALGSVPAPTSENQFCSEVQPGTIFTQAMAEAGLAGTLTINSCSFSGSTGTIGATVVVTSPAGIPPLTMTITYSFQ
jgi:hypothetical protein